MNSNDNALGANWRKATYSNGQAECVEVGTWRKATYSNGQGSCVDVGGATAAVLVRDTKLDGRGPVLLVNRADWARFTGTLR
jgi:hypothetical protein